jgi:hypothetical protein
MRGGNCQRFCDNSGVGEESIAFYPLAEKDVFFENTFPASSLARLNFNVKSIMAT